MRITSGAQFDQNSRVVNVKTAFARPTGLGDNAFLAAVPGKKIRVIAYRLQGVGIVNVKFTDTDGAGVSQTWDLLANEGCAINAPLGSFEFETATGKGLQVNLSAAVACNVSVQYLEVD